MKVVVMARVPRWYGFKRDGTALRILAEGHEIAAIVVETTPTLKSLLEWRKRLGLRIIIAKSFGRLTAVFRRDRGPGDNVEISDNTSNTETTSKRAPEQRSTGGPAGGPASCDSPVIHVKSHNSAECIDRIKALAPDVLVLRGCGILRGPVLETARIGVINCHYALLPEYRGMDVTEWSMLHGTPCAVSAHWVTTGVDDGEVLLAEAIRTDNADSLGELRNRCAALSRELMARALTLIETRALTPTRMTDLTGHQYFVMHPRLYELAEERLKCSS